MKTLEELKAIRDRVRHEINVRRDESKSLVVKVYMDDCGIQAGAKEVLNAFMEGLANKELYDINLIQSGCSGQCQHEPMVEIISHDGNKVTYVNMTPDKVTKVIEEHLIHGNIVKEYLIKED